MTGTDWYSELTGAGGDVGADTPTPAPQPQTNWYEVVTGRPQQEMRAAPFKARPIQDDARKAAPAITAARASLAPDEADQIKRFAAARFPELPLEVAVRRYGIVDGNIVYADEDGNYVREVPSVSGGSGVGDTISRAGKWAASQVGPTIPGVAGAAVGTVTGATPLSIPAAGVAAGTADIVRQVVDRLLAGESVADVDLKNALGHAALNMAGQGVGVGAAKVFNMNPLGVGQVDRLNALDPARRAEIDLLEKEAKKRGIDLTAGQATNMRSLKVQERQLGRKPETMDTMADFAERQQGQQVPAAVRAEIDSITGKPVSAEQGISDFREGANKVVGDVITERKQAAAPVYQKALDDRTDRFWNERLDELMQRPSVQQGLNYAKYLAKDEGKDITVPVFDKGKLVGRDVVPDWRGWDYVKRGMDRLIEENTDPVKGMNAVARSAANNRREMLSILDKANPDYKAARALYGNVSDSVDAVLEGGVGFLNSLKGMDRQQIVDRVFSGKNMLPEEIERMRFQFAKAGKLPDFEAGLSVWLSDKLADAMRVNASGSPGNVAGKFYKSVWGDQRQQEIVRAALGPDKSKSVERLMEVLQAASRSLPEGSPTATDLAGEGSVGLIGKAIGAATSPMTYAKGGQALIDGIEAIRSSPAGRIRLAEALTSGDYAKQLAKLRMLPPKGEKASALAAQMVTSILGGSSGMRTPDDRPVPDGQPE